MIAEHLHAIDSPDPLHPGRPGLVDHTLEDDVVRFCLRRQQERQLVTFPDVFDDLREKSIVVDRFWGIGLRVDIAGGLPSSGLSI
jgi:hypothetical protein